MKYAVFSIYSYGAVVIEIQGPPKIVLNFRHYLDDANSSCYALYAKLLKVHPYPHLYPHLYPHENVKCFGGKMFLMERSYKNVHVHAQRTSVLALLR